MGGVEDGQTPALCERMQGLGVSCSADRAVRAEGNSAKVVKKRPRRLSDESHGEESILAGSSSAASMYTSDGSEEGEAKVLLRDDRKEVEVKDEAAVTRIENKKKEEVGELDHKDLSLVWAGHSEGEEKRGKVFVGSFRFAHFRKGLERFDIKAIVNCTSDATNKFAKEDFQYHRVPLYDDNGQKIPILVLSRANKFIHEQLEKCKNVLIHCTQGRSRSVSIFLSWLIECKRMNLREALFHVKQRRRTAKPNMSFIQQLLDFETKILKTPSLTMEDFEPCPVCLKVKLSTKQFKCGHRCCADCLEEQGEDASCAHCAYSSTLSRERSASIEDVSKWRTAMPPK